MRAIFSLIEVNWRRGSRKWSVGCPPDVMIASMRDKESRPPFQVIDSAVGF